MFDSYFRAILLGDSRLMEIKRAVSTEQGEGASFSIQISQVGSYN